VRLSDIDYDLPEELIAQKPAEPRDSSRLLVDRGPAAPDHMGMTDIADLLGPGDVLVVNDTRVLPARLMLQRSSGGAAEVLLLEPRDDERRRWEALVRPARKLKPGEVLEFFGKRVVRIGARTEAGDTFEVEIMDDVPLALIERIGSMPLPPYIRGSLKDRERYQTVYSRDARSAAAPTAGLHFTEELLARVTARGVTMARVELVVGLDTFKPVTEEDPLNHRIHTETYSVPEETVAACAEAQRVVAVGTTAARALESAAATGNLSGRTSLFITRGHEWKSVDVLLTNFHMPRTSLLLMVDSFVGPRWRRLYAEAVAERYRFLSFGDAMLLDRSLGGA
jgi:S-adenosylmethionine:tRNA ribosyltransferase-isomerase